MRPHNDRARIATSSLSPEATEIPYGGGAKERTTQCVPRGREFNVSYGQLLWDSHPNAGTDKTVASALSL
jgi:hypothetical protein